MTQMHLLSFVLVALATLSLFALPRFRHQHRSLLILLVAILVIALLAYATTLQLSGNASILVFVGMIALIKLMSYLERR